MRARRQRQSILAQRALAEIFYCWGLAALKRRVFLVARSRDVLRVYAKRRLVRSGYSSLRKRFYAVRVLQVPSVTPPLLIHPPTKAMSLSARALRAYSAALRSAAMLTAHVLARLDQRAFKTSKAEKLEELARELRAREERLAAEARAAEMQRLRDDAAAEREHCKQWEVRVKTGKTDRFWIDIGEVSGCVTSIF